MEDNHTEWCGRCSMTTVVDAIDAVGDGHGRNPWDGPRIEVSEDEMRIVGAPGLYIERAKTRLDEWATKLIYGR